MKTREKKNGLPIVQAPVRGISDESLTTPLSSTECSRKRRKDIYIYIVISVCIWNLRKSTV